MVDLSKTKFFTYSFLKVAINIKKSISDDTTSLSPLPTWCNPK
ncbi:hypothetical protein THOG11_70281 [Vibrio harveyi]|nr:hypothetical protein VHARVF571_630047 [Vibrio harveyi]CAH1587897.1 hypothetical protein THOG11_70281 [Vibrio harveyi]